MHDHANGPGPSKERAFLQSLLQRAGASSGSRLIAECATAATAPGGRR